MGVRIERYGKGTTSKNKISLTGFNGLATAYNDDLIPATAFSHLENVELDLVGSLSPRTGYKEINNIKFVPNDFYANDFDKTNFQGYFSLNYINKQGGESSFDFFIIDGLLFDNTGKDITLEILVTLIFKYDRNSKTAQFYKDTLTLKDIVRSPSDEKIRLNRKSKNIKSSNYFNKLYIPISLNIDFKAVPGTGEVELQNNFLLMFDGSQWKFVEPYVPNSNEIKTLGFNNLVYSQWNEKEIIKGMSDHSLNENLIIRKLSYYKPNEEGDIIGKYDDTTKSVITPAKILDIMPYPLEPITLEELQGAPASNTINNPISEILTSWPNRVVSSNIPQFTVPEPRGGRRNTFTWYFPQFPQYTLITLEYEGNKEVHTIDLDLIVLSVSAIGKGYVWNKDSPLLDPNDLQYLVLNGRYPELKSVSSFKLSKPFEFILKGVNLQNEIIKSINENYSFSNVKVSIKLFEDDKRNTEAGNVFEIDLTNSLNNFILQNRKYSNVKISDNSIFKIKSDIFLNYWRNDVPYPSNTYDIMLSNIQWEIEGTITGDFQINKDRDEIIYLKSHIATGNDLNEVYSYKEIDQLLNADGKVNWYIYPWIKNKQPWDEKSIWKDVPSFDPNDPSKLSTPLEPDFTKWIRINDEASFTKSSTLLRLWNPNDIFLVGFEIEKLGTVAQKDEPINFWKLMELNNENKDYFIDFPHISSCDKSVVINQQLFLWNGDMNNDDAKASDEKKKNRIFISQINNFAYFPSDNYIDLDIQKNERILAIKPFQNHYVIITNYNIFYLSGNNPSNFKLTHINKNIGVISGESALAYGNYIYFLNEDGIWLLKGIYNNDDRANVELISTIINKNFLLNLKEEDMRASIGVVNKNILYWFFPTQRICIKYYPEISKISNLQTFAFDTSDLFTEIKSIYKSGSRFGFWIYDNNLTITQYLKTIQEENFWVDGSDSNNFPYRFIIKSVNDTFLRPMVNKHLYNIQFKFGLPSTETDKDLINLSKIKVNLSVFIDNIKVYGDDTLTKGINNTLDIDSQSKEYGVHRGLILDNKQTGLGLNQLGLTNEIIKGARITGIGSTISYQLIIPVETNFALIETMAIFRYKRASISMKKNQILNKKNYKFVGNKYIKIENQD